LLNKVKENQELIEKEEEEDESSKMEEEEMVKTDEEKKKGEEGEEEPISPLSRNNKMIENLQLLNEADTVFREILRVYNEIGVRSGEIRGDENEMVERGEEES